MSHATYNYLPLMQRRRFCCDQARVVAVQAAVRCRLARGRFLASRSAAITIQARSGCTSVKSGL